jgi:hypothetical protein
MSNILLVEPDYRSKFPPLGLMRISTYHKRIGDAVTFTRGKVSKLREANWHRIYISSLFTYELPRTVETIKYYLSAVEKPSDIFVGGIGATLLPQYIKDRVKCQVIEGPLDQPNMLGPDTPAIATYVPDYDMISSVDWEYEPEDSYFCRVTKGCIRKCKFCAVPILEPAFGYSNSIDTQIREVRERFGERQHLVLLDNNILAIDGFEAIINEIRQQEFQAGAIRNNRKRTIDFNQGIDARLITPEVARLLATICLSPVRLAFDHDGIEKQYRRAIHLLAQNGFDSFTNYVMFNFNDTPLSFYKRLKVNLELSTELGIRVTGFPMRYVPIDDVNRRYVSKDWRWRYLRGIQCVLTATHGMVSPNPEFFDAAFGAAYKEFLEILAMPDRYIIYRSHFRREAGYWKRSYRALSAEDKEEFLTVLAKLNKSRTRKADIATHKKFKSLLDHYYPNGEAPPSELK